MRAVRRAASKMQMISGGDHTSMKAVRRAASKMQMISGGDHTSATYPKRSAGAEGGPSPLNVTGDPSTHNPLPPRIPCRDKEGDLFA